MPDKKAPLLSRPKDRSLESFKKWMTEFVNYINPDHGSSLTEDQWKDKHKRFWAKVDASK